VVVFMKFRIVGADVETRLGVGVSYSVIFLIILRRSSLIDVIDSLILYNLTITSEVCVVGCLRDVIFTFNGEGCNERDERSESLKVLG